VISIEHYGKLAATHLFPIIRPDTVAKLVLDTPEADVRELRGELCQAGDVLPIEGQV